MSQVDVPAVVKRRPKRLLSAEQKYDLWLRMLWLLRSPSLGHSESVGVLIL